MTLFMIGMLLRPMSLQVGQYNPYMEFSMSNHSGPIIRQG